ncbi:chemotaxis protein [Bradyrhizobium sp. 83012]|uniref:Chemotaxis protein n=1 Tax=Bradyrhizobium aeschynomenes TaxID=2734909 RepID=A0ABX2CBU0_9BRAD|nr:protein phosphatase CheZ [Bradyrhizobium aeschynomenes]NPU09843.1 chemotaxis protein [Bradyrhizobium aeschynomenes]NPU65691.1 chemotaxis protein [Bradyrhizobium aeschynomenes]
MIAPEEERMLKTLLVEMFGNISSMRRELAALQGDKGSFASMTDTLDAIVENTEVAGNTILESMEAISASVAKLQGVKDPATVAVCDEIVDSTNKVFEACAFQDLTGQRITRVVKSLKFMEEHINRLVRIWGKDELARMAAELAAPSTPSLLNGPQRTGVAISQDDIDKLFG